MWKWPLMRNADVNLWYILGFLIVAIGLVYSIDFIYRKLKKKTK